ncbi:MAG: type II 3-dehydroquinate dehydratase [Clostridia bacterium]|nr:type II 3-dehydroquinate dehydratase [Clostridia bacterium]
MNILVINGPNLNFLGIREPEHYGTKTYKDLVKMIDKNANRLGVKAECYQSNHEGEIVDKIQSAYNRFDGIIINPAAYTHTSVAILDAIKAVNIPTIEVHISDPDMRDEFRKVSYIRQACIETVKGLGFDGYIKAMEDMKEYLINR